MNQAGHMVKVHDENIESILLYTHTQTQTIMIIVQFFLWMAMITNYCVVAVLLMVVFITFHHYNGWNWFFFLVLSNSFHRFDIKPRDPFVNCNAKHVSDSHNNKKWRKLNDPKSKSINYDDDNSVIRSFLFFLKLHNHFKQIFPFELCVIYIFFGQKQMWLVRWWFWFISKKKRNEKKIWMKSKSFLKGHKPLTKKKITAWT